MLKNYKELQNTLYHSLTYTVKASRSDYILFLKPIKVSPIGLFRITSLPIHELFGWRYFWIKDSPLSSKSSDSRKVRTER